METSSCATSRWPEGGTPYALNWCARLIVEAANRQERQEGSLGKPRIQKAQDQKLSAFKIAVSMMSLEPGLR